MRPPHHMRAELHEAAVRSPSGLALTALGATASILVSACHPEGALDTGIVMDSGVDAPEDACLQPAQEVDLLFMVDNSDGMAEEQASVAMYLPELVNILTSGDADGDGIADFPPVRFLDVGIVTSDMGTGGFSVPTCIEANAGDDGVLRTQGNTAVAGCQVTYPAFLTFRGDPSAFARDVACVARVGLGGCAFEQPLDAVLKAITPSTSSIRFAAGDRLGHADRVNAGFVLSGSLLAVVFVSDEDDCSAVDTDVFNPSSAVYTGGLNFRCVDFPGAIHPVTRYSDGYLEARPPSRLVVMSLVGIPLDAEGADYADILTHPDMIQEIDPEDPIRLRSSCEDTGRGLAFPPVRFVELSQNLVERGAVALVRSICQADYAGAFQSLSVAILQHMTGTCP